MNAFDSSMPGVLRFRQVRWLFPVVALFLAACGQKAAPPPGPPPCTADAMTQRCVCERAPDSALCACLTNPPAEGCGCLIDPEQPQCRAPCPDADAQTHTREALILADDGEWDEARARIRCALDANPSYQRALKVQGAFDPGYLAANFPQVSVMYTVQPGDTLGSIARQCLKDTDLFVAIALANDIERPASLIPGDKLKITGVESCAVQPVAPPDPLAEAQKAEQRGDYEGAHGAIVEALSRSPDDPEVISAAARIKTAYIGQLRDKAYAAQDGGKPAEALRLWKLVQTLDPQNKEALLNINVLSPSNPSN